MRIDELLKIMVSKKASDLHLKVGMPAIFRIDGKLTPLDGARLTPEELEGLIFSILTERQKQKFLDVHELDLSYSVPGLARFRANVSKQRGTVRVVMRRVPFTVPDFEELNLPTKVLGSLAKQPAGIVLLTGPTGSGKSTTLASMIEYINTTRNCHIVTIEDPIEFLYRDKLSIISQREIGTDTDSFNSALRHVLRQDPNVILIGEMRDLETIQTAITAAETGHLVLSTLHTNEAAQTIDRIIDTFPPHQQAQTRIQIAHSLEGVITQRLLPLADGEGRIPAIEILIATPLVRKMILEKTPPSKIYEAVQSGGFYGMQTLNQALVDLIKKGKIRQEDAFEVSPNPDELALNLKGIFAGSGTVDQQRWYQQEITKK